MELDHLKSQFKQSSFPSENKNEINLAEKKLVLIKNPTKPENAEFYKTFRKEFQIYLMKLSNGNLKTLVSNIFDKNLIYVGEAVDKVPIFVRLINEHGKFGGVILNASSLEIDISTGHSDRIDDCVYAAYFGLVRAAIILNEQEIKSDEDLHKLLSYVLYLFFLKSFDKWDINSEKLRNFIHAVCTIIYYKHFLLEKTNSAINLFKKYHSNSIFNNDNYKEEFYSLLSSTKAFDSYSSTKDIPNVLVDMKIYMGNPKQLLVNLFKNLKNQISFYSFVGPLDMFVGMTVLSKTPMSFFNKSTFIGDKLYNNIENKISDYIKKIKYSSDSLVNNLS